MFIAASLIPIKGAYVLNSALYGDPAYRDVRGIPFIFLKRSLGDGECDINDVKIGICDPRQGNEPHAVSVSMAAADLTFWTAIAAVFIVPSCTANDRRPACGH